MKKDFTNAAEELITGISSAGETVSKKEEAAEGGYLRYVRAQKRKDESASFKKPCQKA